MVLPVKRRVHQTKGQSAVLGCVVSSYPDAIINWLKLSQTSKSTHLSNDLNISSAFEYIIADSFNSKYQIHKYKQSSNQTVSYLTIKVRITPFKFKIIITADFLSFMDHNIFKNLEESDYAKYKCEVSNIVGRNDSVIELISNILNRSVIKIY
jgi:hypothetical protein